MDHAPPPDQDDDHPAAGRADLDHALRTPLTLAVLRVHLLRRRLQRGETVDALAPELDRIADSLSEVIAALTAIENAERRHNQHKRPTRQVKQSPLDEV